MAKETNSRFFRRYGGYIFGGIFAAALIGLAVVGKKHDGSAELKLRYYRNYFDKAASQPISQPDSSHDYSSEPELTEQEIYDSFFNIKDLDLKYEAHINGFADGFSDLYYDVTFKTELPEDIKTQIENEIEKKCGKNVDDNRYGDVTVVTFPEKKKVGIELSLNQINTDKGVLGIFKALNEIDSIESVILDKLTSDGYDSSSQEDSSSDVEFDSSDPANKQADEVYNELFGIPKLGLYYPVHFRGLDGENFTYNVIFSDAIDQSKLDTLASEIVKALGDDTDSSFSGYYNIKKPADNRIQIYLDLGNADNDNAVTGILKAINAIDGVKEVIMN